MNLFFVGFGGLGQEVLDRIYATNIIKTFKVTPNSSDILYNQVNDSKKRKLIMEDINKANMFTSNNVVDTEYFLLFKDKNNDVLQKRIRMLINNLASAGLTAFQTNNNDLRMILDNFLNGGQTTTFGTVLA